MWKHKLLEQRNNKWISRAALQEVIDPPVEAAMQGELSSEDLVFAEYDEQAANRDAQSC